MNVKENTGERMEVEFRYCPLVAAWQKLGATEGEISLLCDIAMEGDRGIVSAYADFRMELGQTIAGGANCCTLAFGKK
jgi:hypothetical protein